MTTQNVVSTHDMEVATTRMDRALHDLEVIVRSVPSDIAAVLSETDDDLSRLRTQQRIAGNVAAVLLSVTECRVVMDDVRDAAWSAGLAAGLRLRSSSRSLEPFSLPTMLRGA